jgi:hypothetical protein
MVRRFRFLRFFCVAMKILAWLILIGSFIVAPFIAAALKAAALNGGAAIPPSVGVLETGYVWIIALVFGVVHFFGFYALSEIILLFLAIEENTRKAAV